jgi:hypothetical protein
LDALFATTIPAGQESGSDTVGFATIAFVTGPGLAKTRGHPVVLARQTLLVRASDARWREMFEHADAVSEGSVRKELHGRIWYGSTSLILPTAASDALFLAAVAERDVHVRVRALRTAYREARSRAPSALGRFSCEVRVAADACGVRIDVDVQAPLIESRVAK